MARKNKIPTIKTITYVVILDDECNELGIGVVSSTKTLEQAKAQAINEVLEALGSMVTREELYALEEVHEYYSYLD